MASALQGGLFCFGNLLIVPVTSHKPHLLRSVIVLLVSMWEELQEPCQALVFGPVGLVPEHGTHTAVPGIPQPRGHHPIHSFLTREFFSLIFISWSSSLEF